SQFSESSEKRCKYFFFLFSWHMVALICFAFKTNTILGAMINNLNTILNGSVWYIIMGHYKLAMIGLICICEEYVLGNDFLFLIFVSLILSVPIWIIGSI
ncbi:hypothetical protein ACJX0J_019122, partial [Zea mays]